MAATTPLYQPTWRSLLYVPVTSEKFVETAHTRGADAIVLELEDGVAPSEKERARGLVADAAPVAGQAGADVLVRINRPWTLAVKDIEASVCNDVCGLVLPKVDSADHVRALADVVEEVERDRGVAVGSTAFFLRIESPEGVLNAAEIADAHPRVVGLGLGVGDFSFSLGVSQNGLAVTIAAFQVVLAAAAAGRVPLGLASAIANFADTEEYRSAVTEARRLGFRGALCVHPRQVPILNEIFSPTPEDYERAQEIISEYEPVLAQGVGAMTTSSGIFVDAPVYEYAKRMLAQASPDRARS
jgi:citrate lyase subunit beta/citryl-CoA lyase